MRLVFQLLPLIFRPKFRSYRPQDETLQEAKLDDAEPAVVDNEVKDLLEAGKEKVLKIDFHISTQT